MTVDLMTNSITAFNIKKQFKNIMTLVTIALSILTISITI
jgi:hypothetical protein